MRLRKKNQFLPKFIFWLNSLLSQMFFFSESLFFFWFHKLKISLRLWFKPLFFYQFINETILKLFLIHAHCPDRGTEMIQSISLRAIVFFFFRNLHCWTALQYFHNIFKIVFFLFLNSIDLIFKEIEFLPQTQIFLSLY